MNRRQFVIAVMGVQSFSAIAVVGFLPTLSVGGAIAQAAEATQTVIFTVENMTCALCPVTVKTAMERINGVKSVTIDFEAKTATVIFDPAQATSDAIAKASSDVGYPAHPGS